jgi:hypothetical protein
MSQQDAPKKERKQRSDKGLIMATRRDIYCIAWIADQYAARVDQIRRLLSRFPDARKPFKNGELMGESTAKDLVARWQRAGWIECRRVLADMPAWAWCTKKGLALVGRDDLYTAREPASTRLGHIYAVNEIRMWMDYEHPWKSERRYRAEELKKLTKKGDDLGPIPDAVLIVDGDSIAVEVEISAKKPADVEEKLIRLVRRSDYSPKGMYAPVFPGIWFYVPNEKLKKLIESACEEVLTKEEQERVSVVVEEDILASRFR